MARRLRNIRGKCPRCCPDGGALFDRAYDDEVKHLGKRCQNCGLWLPVRKTNYKPAAPNQRQQWTIEQLAEAFGGSCEVRMIGRDAWVTLKNYEGRNFYLGQSAYGTIGPRGAFSITLQRPFGDKVCRDGFDIRNYLTTTTKAPAAQS